MGDFLKKFEYIYRFLYLIKDNLIGFKILFDVENKVVVVVVFGVLLSGVGFLGSFLINCIVLYYGIFVGIVVVGILIGIVFFSIIIFDCKGSFEIVCERVV